MKSAHLSPANTAQSLVKNKELWADEGGSAVSSDELLSSIRHQFKSTLGLELDSADAEQLYQAIALAVREQLMPNWRASRNQFQDSTLRRACYLSLEFLLGRTLNNAVLNLDLNSVVQDALTKLGVSYEVIRELEPDAGLGNGGLGRLAACFLDSCATLGLPVMGYGLRYRYGMFRQSIEDGYQHELPDNWLLHDHPWEVQRPEHRCTVPFGGQVDVEVDSKGREHRVWNDTDSVMAVPYDIPIPGFENDIVNTLRLWSATATDAFNLAEFNAGSYADSVASKVRAQSITMVLYPNDASENGKELRLRQQYFLVSASLQDATSQWLTSHDNFDSFANAHCFQMNDTHPSLAVAELMRLLIDEHHLKWNDAWSITTRTMAYTNHTLLPEALECWSLGLMQHLLPRPTEIIREINNRFLDDVRQKWPDNTSITETMSIVSYDDHPVVRMAHLAIVGSFSINGVAALHSTLLQQGLFKSFFELWPERFNNKTNGVTPRRWLAHCNPALRTFLNNTIGEHWQKNIPSLEKLKKSCNTPAVLTEWRDIKNANKLRLAELVAQRTGIVINENMIFDVQVKRLHEYKRQLLCALHAIHVYLKLKSKGKAAVAPRAIIIAGKAAPGYDMAKWIIKFINNVADVINNDADTDGHLRLVFLPDYNVSSMEVICPATDLSEQISTAGKEASGTGNMKFMMNGALTIGTLDGANVEILEAVGPENFFLFGLDVHEVGKLAGNYSPAKYIEADPRIKTIVDAINAGQFDGSDAELVKRVMHAAQSNTDPWMTFADLGSYIDAQSEVETLWKDQPAWSRKSLLNTAASARFSSDRTINDYNNDIWKLQALSAK
ncbi:MAG: glycogen/starch/alpha-glucan phosphorylase [Granulosicoccaceae bacterium]